MIGMISLLFWSVHYLKNRDAGVFKKEMIATIVILFFLVYPNIVKMNFAVFSCQAIEAGEYWLIDNLDIRCWDTTHVAYSILVALPVILIWGIGVPTLIWIYLARHKHDLDWIENKLRFGFLYNGYRKGTFYWEFVILYRKILVICCAVFLGTISIQVQALTVLLILLVFLYMQSSTRPYSHPTLNELEMRGIMVASVTIYCGLYFLTDDLDQNTKLFLFAAMMLANLYFILYWLEKMFTAFFAILATSISFLKKYVPLGDSFANSKIQSDPLVKSAYILGEEKFASLWMLDATEVIEQSEAEQNTLDSTFTTSSRIRRRGRTHTL
jgi:hypothetical protein